jgi:hypothetical protein
VPDRPEGLLGSNRSPLPRFRPLQRFPGHGEPHTPGESHLIRLRCALRVSHPPDALLPPRPAELVSSRSRSWGLPSEAFIPPTVPYALSSAATLLGLLPRTEVLRAPLQGLAHRQGSRPKAWGLARLLRRMPPWAFPPPRSLVRYGGCGATAPRPSPLALSRPVRVLNVPPAPQGISRTKRRRSLSRPANPLEVSHLVDPLDSLGPPPRWDMGSPRKRFRVTTKTAFLFA